MGQIVAAAGVPHAPQLLAAPETEDLEQVKAVHQSMGQLRDRIVAARPDALLVIGGDHIDGFFLDGIPALGVFCGLECRGTFAHYQFTFKAHESLARHVVQEGIARGFDLLYTQDRVLDYAFFIPLRFTMPDPPLPIVPIFVNVYVPPQPTPGRCYQWGQALAEIVKGWPGRVAVLASGGLSHYPGTSRYASPDYDFDAWAMKAMEAGEGREFGRLTSAKLDATGNVELRTWITLMGAIGDAKAKFLTYQPSWHHGYGVCYWDV